MEHIGSSHFSQMQQFVVRNFYDNNLEDFNYTSIIFEFIKNVVTNEKSALTNSTTDWRNYKEFINNNLNLNCKIKKLKDV